MELRIKIQDKDYDKVTAFLKTLDAEIVSNGTYSNVAHEPLTPYGKKKRPSADEIEQMIIKKAMLDAKAIERGELETRDLEDFLIELENN